MNTWPQTQALAPISEATYRRTRAITAAFEAGVIASGTIEEATTRYLDMVAPEQPRMYRLTLRGSFRKGYMTRNGK